jgi:hypothetical protein
LRAAAPPRIIIARRWFMRYAFLLCCLAALLAGCAKKIEPILPPLTKAEISGDRLWKRITVDTDYDIYASWPGMKGMRPGQSPHGKFHEVYINATLATALPIASKTAPNGSIIVKENFTADKKLSNVTVMAKVSGYNPEDGDWFWAKYDPEGKVIVEGEVETCYQCHEGVKDNDYAILWPLDAPVPAGGK